MSDDRQGNTKGGVVDMGGEGVGARRGHLRLYGWSLVLGWTLAVIGLLTWSVVQKRRGDIDEAKTRADVARQKDISYRRWVQKHGGVYVPVSSLSPPNEYLRVPERDITTPSGKQLTLVNSSYMVRQVAELAGDDITVRTHVTSLNPLRPENKADAGETKALHEFERGAKEAVWREWIGGTEYLRTMRPYIVEQACMKCHAQQGYKVGDLRGGIATSVALPTVARSMAMMWPTFVGFGLLWIVGWAGIGVAWRRVSRYEQEGEQIDARLRYAASHDTLTGLANRTMLMEHLSSAIEQMHREGRKFAVLFLDLDRFKLINDCLGHGTGDQLLIALAHRLRKRLDEMRDLCGGSMVARLGGDEFVVLLEGLVQAEGAERLAREVQQWIAAPFVVGGHEVYCTVSMGIVVSEKHYTQPEEVLRDADTALYSAKGAGRARQVVFNETMQGLAMERLRLDNELRKAIERDEFVVYYQPIVALESGHIEGFEALVRWAHPERGLVSPVEFIPVAEETGLIVPIGWKILEAACEQLGRLGQQYPGRGLWVAVNLSKRQLTEKGLVEQVGRLIERSGVRAELLKLEVTESVVMEHAESVTPVLGELRKLGVKLAMDDFGTGHSSLSCLHRFPVAYLKIDRAFISHMGLNRPYVAVVQAVVTLAHNLGMRVIAEGVETLDQVAQLQALDCDFGQGYLFSKPVPAARLAGLLATSGWLRKSA